LLLASRYWPAASDQQPAAESCKEINRTKIYHTIFVTFFGDTTLEVVQPIIQLRFEILSLNLPVFHVFWLYSIPVLSP